MPAAHARTMPQGSGTQCLSFCTLPGGVRIDCACIVKSSWGTLKAHQDSFWCPSGGKPENNRRHAFQFVKIYLAYMERHGLVNDEGVLEVCVMFILWLLPKGQRALPTNLQDGPTWVNQIKAKASELDLPSEPPASLRSSFAELACNAKIGNRGNKALLPKVCEAARLAHAFSC